jgi:septum formation protein
MTASDDQQQDSVNPMEALGLPCPLLLGSASFTRKLILKEMKIPYHIVVWPINEKDLGDRTDPPDQLVLALGKAKANFLVQKIHAGRCDQDLLPLGLERIQEKNFLVLTGDQVMTCIGTTLEKPEGVQQAKHFVSQYPTHLPSTVGSCVLTHIPTGIQVAGVDTATVHFDSNFDGATLVDELLQEEAPILSCAGGLMVEHPKVKAVINRIDETEDSVMGLSSKSNHPCENCPTPPHLIESNTLTSSEFSKHRILGRQELK